MSEITDLERRITQALDRIRAGVDTLGTVPPMVAPILDDAPEETVAEAAPATDTAELESLRAELEDERTANAQLEERVRVIRRKQEGRVKKLEEQLAEAQTQLAASEAACAHLKAAADKLRQSNQDLRKANAEGLSEPHLINRAMMTELDALRAARAADVAEADAILGAIGGLVDKEASDA